MNANLTDITLLVDRSGSMGGIKDDMIGGMNAFLDAQKAVPGRATVSLFVFDDRYERRFTAAELDTLRRLGPDDLDPRGSTALRDAMGRCIEETGKRLAAMPEPERPARVLFIVVTDGLENASNHVTAEMLLAAITTQRDIYKWEFIYIGANQDAFAVAGDFGIPASNVMNYAFTSAGVLQGASNLSAAVGRSRSAGPEKSFAFTAEEQDAR